jgi:hypothetical protein
MAASSPSHRLEMAPPVARSRSMRSTMVCGGAAPAVSSSAIHSGWLEPFHSRLECDW